MAPDLVQIHEKYAPLGVVFLGFTTRSREQASTFTKETAITWPNAYGVDSLSIAAPVIYVIGADGHIAWSDERSRYRHDIDDLRADVEAAIDRELRGGALTARPPTDAVSGPRAAMPLHGG